MITVSRALQRRMARLRSGDREAGIVLPFVLLVTLLVVILATTVASLTISKVRPASRTVNSAAATAAAQAGIDAFTAFLATTCPQPGRCAAINSTVAAGTLPGSDGAGQSTYTWQVLNALYYVTDQFLRVQSIGLSRGVRKVLIADFQGTPNLLDFAYYTEFETASPTDLLKQYGPRAIRITDATIGALTTPTLAANSTLTWAGAKTTAMTGASPTTSVDICNRRYYDTVSGSTAVQGRYTLRAKLPRNGDWAETGASGASTFTHNGQCEVAFGSSSQFIGPVYSLDALLLSNGVVGGPGPNFQQSVSSAWGSTSAPPAPLGAPWRSQLVVGGAPTGTNRPTTVNYQLNLPPAVTAAQFPAGNGTCVYTGPTRIKIDGAFAVVTSPQTTTIPLGNLCNPNADPAIAGSAGVAGARIALANLRIAYIADGADTTTQISGKSPITSANSVFSLSSPTVAPISTTPAAGAVTADLLKQFPGCTLLSCLLGTAEQRFTTETGKTPEQLQVLVQAGAGASTAFNPQTYLQSRLPADTAAVRYRALAAVPGSAGPTAGTPTVASLAASTDPFFAATTGSRTQTPYTTSTSSAVAIVRQVATCSLLGAFGICIGTAGWSTDDPQIAVTVQRPSSYITTTTTVAATATFPKAGDVTLYGKGAGDAYVEGPLSGTLSIVAAHDIVLTGDVKDSTTSGTASTTDGLALVANNDIRIYHPVSCKVAETITSPGHCANDITGAYVNGLLDFSKHPSQQYISMSRVGNSTGALSASEQEFKVTAAMFALSGSVTVDNYDRGTALAGLAFTGGVYQLHHGATGSQWELAAGSAIRDRSGYLVSYTYANIGLRSLPYVPTAAAAVAGRVWNLISTSSATAPVAAS